MTTLLPEHEQLRVSIERLRSMLDGLVVRGLRACGPDELRQLQAYAEDLERSGAGHVSSILVELRERIERNERDAARTLLMAQTSVRLLERLLTLRAVRGAYDVADRLAAAGGIETAEAGDDADEDEK
ncbi:MAG TPA: hypothetical protein VGI81_06180 [Tepidisphaeraceae bacterium]|jgi:hypothetical protein